MQEETLKRLKAIAKEVRKLIIKATYEAGSGHPGGSLSATEIVTYLYFHAMKLDPANPQMPERDKFVLSKGHASPLLYAVLAEKGFFPKEDVLKFRKIGEPFQGHPCRTKLAGVEMSTGSLGQGFSASVGMALAGKLDGKDSTIYVLLGDGEIQEGIVWEAAMSAGHYKLSNLIAFVDWNGLQIDGTNDKVMTVTPIDKKFEAFGWNAILIDDGHDFEKIDRALRQAKEENPSGQEGKPTVIIAKTHKGHGVSFMEDQAGWHGKAPNKDQAIQALQEIEEA